MDSQVILKLNTAGFLRRIIAYQEINCKTIATLHAEIEFQDARVVSQSMTVI